MALFGETRTQKGIGYLLTTINGLGGLITLSRGYILGFGIASLVAVALALAQRRLRSVNLVFGLAMASVVYAVLVQVGGVTALSVRMDTIAHPVVANPRASIWKVGVTAFKTSPLIGIGIGVFEDSYAHYQGMTGALGRYFVEGRAAHNVYLELAVELGAIGLFLLVAYYLCLGVDYRRLWHWAKSHGGHTSLIVGIGLAAIGLLVGALFSNLLFRKIFWLVPALLASYGQLSNVRSECANAPTGQTTAT